MNTVQIVWGTIIRWDWNIPMPTLALKIALASCLRSDLFPAAYGKILIPYSADHDTGKENED